jgi:hypothetical protein
MCLCKGKNPLGILEKKKKKKKGCTCGQSIFRNALHFYFFHVTPSGYQPDIHWVSWDFKALDRGHYPKNKIRPENEKFLPKKSSCLLLVTY